MDHIIFQQKVTELLKEIGPLSETHRKQLSILAEKTVQYHQDLKKSAAILKDSLDYLRLCVKYIMFDLEATHRENNYLRQLLQTSGDDNTECNPY